MHRRTFLHGLGAAALAAGPWAGRSAFADEDDKDAPNIILVVGDDISAGDFGCYGGTEFDTPFIDRMAREGVRFQTAWAAPVCGPARAMLLTGKYNDKTGMWRNAGRLGQLTNNLLLGKAMKRAGYVTGMYGKLHHGGRPTEDYGFDEYCICRYWKGYDGTHQDRGSKTKGMYAVQWYWHPGLVANGKGVPTGPKDFGPEIEVERMLDFIRRHREKRFFALWTTNLRHGQHSKKRGWYLPDVPELNAAGVPTGKRIPGSNKSHLHYLDAKVAQIARTLSELDLQRRTIILFTADNGRKGKGHPASEAALRVPLVAWGGAIPALGARSELIDFTDIMPTLLALGGARVPDDLDGHSFAPALLGKKFTPRKWIRSQGELQRPKERRGQMGSWARDKDWLLDADEQLWYCGAGHDPTRYRKATPDMAGAREARARLARLRKSAGGNKP